MRRTIFLLMTFCYSMAFAQQTHEWENQYILQINREPARSSFVPYLQKKGDSSISLDGEWKFRWVSTPQERIPEFYCINFDDSQWVNFPIPANWEVNGYGTPIYVSAGYPFKIAPPRVMDTPREDYTTFIERNPVGQYSNTFSCPYQWTNQGQTFIRFEGVSSAFYLWINGKKVGIAKVVWSPANS